MGAKFRGQKVWRRKLNRFIKSLRIPENLRLMLCVRTLQKYQFSFQKCYHHYDKNCRIDYDISYELKYGRECITTHTPLCSNLVHTVYIQKCDGDTRQKCEGRRRSKEWCRDTRCHNSYECHGQKCNGVDLPATQSLHHSHHQKCQDQDYFCKDDQRQPHCHQAKIKCIQIPKKIPKKECIHVPQSRCKEYPIKTPKKIPRKECELIPKVNCEKVPKKVPRKVLKLIPKRHCKRRRKKKFRFFG